MEREKIIEENTNLKLGLIPRRKFDKILDLGCSDGIISKKIKDITQSEVIGVDNCKETNLLAKERGIEIVESDVNQKLPFADNSFDFIFAGEIIEHVLSPDDFLLEVKRVLKNEGIFVLTTPNLASWHNRILLLFGILPYSSEVSTKDSRIGMGILRKIKQKKPAGHIRVFPLGAMKEMLAVYGFAIDKIKGRPTDFMPYPFRFFEKLISFFPSLSSGFVVRCINKK